MTDPIDNANDMAQFTNDLALHQHQRDRERTHQVWLGGVVVCMDCEAAIPSDRLLALPECARCIDCQTMYEIRERQ